MHDASSDIEFVGMSVNTQSNANATPEPLRCQFCQVNFEHLSVEKRQAHYDQHFDDPGESSSPHDPSGFSGFSKGNMSPKKFSKRLNSFAGDKGVKDAFWYASIQDDPPANHTPGLIPFLRKALTTAVERNQTRRAVLCYDGTVHIYHEMWDTGWGCGYRNYLMACTALMDQRFQDMYFSLLDAPTSPSVNNLKALIEQAWNDGFDQEGAKQLKHKLVDRREWIGTAELYVAFTYRGIPSQLADFHLPGNMVTPLLEWIKAYFSPQEDHKHSSIQDSWRGLSPVIVTDRMPLILQHQGHSRTIVGYEITKNGSTNLLTFDPSRRIPSDTRNEVLARFTKSRANQPAPSSSTPKSGTAHRLMHSIFQAHGKRRASPSLSPKKSAVKRMRAGSIKDEGEIIVIDSDDENTAGQSTTRRGKNESRNIGNAKGKGRDDGESGKTDPVKALKLFRLDEKTLAKKEKYQVLWFPLHDPLTDAEKRARRVVTSDKVC